MKRYELRSEIPEKTAQDLKEFHPLIQKLLFHRGIYDKDSALRFISPNFERDLHDPFLMPNMDVAVERILKAISENQKVIIYSDYDADGIPASVTLHDFFKKIGFNNFDIYIPHRNREGFGLNKKAIEEIASKEFNLMITIDCGTADVEEVSLARSLGMDVIITDHHEAHEVLPDAIIVNHKLIESNYPERILCGAGVVFKLIQALIQKGNFNLPKGFEKWFLDMTGVATMADMVPLVGENRALAHYGLLVLRKSPRLGLQQLLRKTGVKQNDINAMDIGFTIAPRINAASRMGEPDVAFKMLSTTDISEAGELVNHLHEINDARKGHVAAITKAIHRKYEEVDDMSKLNVIVAGNPDWQPSLLGLAASGIAEKYQKPVFLWGKGDGDELKGSCRSANGVSTLALLNAVSDLMHAYGGHDQAGGFVVRRDVVDFLHERLSEAYNLCISAEPPAPIFVDAQLSIKDINKNLFNEIQKLSPFGIGNEEPKFLIKNVLIKDVQMFGKTKNHLKLICEDENINIEAIAFFSTEESFSNKIIKGQRLSLVSTIEMNQWGRRTLRLRLLDVLL